MYLSHSPTVFFKSLNIDIELTMVTCIITYVGASMYGNINHIFYNTSVMIKIQMPKSFSQ